MNDDLMQKIKMTGWMSAAAGFLFLALSNFVCLYTIKLAALALLVAGASLFWCERVKSAIVIMITGLLIYFLSIDESTVRTIRMLVLFLLYIGVIFYFKPTRLNKSVIAVVWKLVVLQIVSLALEDGRCYSVLKVSLSLVVVFQLVLAACFISRKYLPLEEIILKYEAKTRIKYLSKLIWEYLSKLMEKIPIPKFLRSQKPAQEYNPIQKFCKYYAYSVFAIGLIFCAVFIFWASPTKKSPEWNKDLIIMSITQLVGCVILGYFVLSQISCAIKLRERQIVAGSAPVYLLFVSALCWLLSAFVAFGIVYLFAGDGLTSNADWTLTLALVLVDIPTMLQVVAHCNPKFSITLSAVVTIWHLIGCGFVALLIRDNIAKILSLEDVSAHKT